MGLYLEVVMSASERVEEMEEGVGRTMAGLMSVSHIELDAAIGGQGGRDVFCMSGSLSGLGTENEHNTWVSHRGL